VATRARSSTFERVVGEVFGCPAATCSHTLMEILREWEVDGDGRFTLDDVAQAAIFVERQQRVTRSLACLVAAAAVGWLLTLLILFAIAYVSSELMEDVTVDRFGRMVKKSDGKTVISTRAAMESIDIFDLLTIDLADLYKLESLAFSYKIGVGMSVDTFLRISEVTRNAAIPLVEIKFLTGQRMEIMPVGAQFFIADTNATGGLPVAFVKGPEYADDSPLLVRCTPPSCEMEAPSPSRDGNNATAAAVVIEAMGVTNGGDRRRRKLVVPSIFGRPERNSNIYFNGGDIWSWGFNDLGAGRFEALFAGGWRGSRGDRNQRRPRDRRSILVSGSLGSS